MGPFRRISLGLLIPHCLALPLSGTALGSGPSALEGDQEALSSLAPQLFLSILRYTAPLGHFQALSPCPLESLGTPVWCQEAMCSLSSSAVSCTPGGWPSWVPSVGWALLDDLCSCSAPFPPVPRAGQREPAPEAQPQPLSEPGPQAQEPEPRPAQPGPAQCLPGQEATQVD